MMKTTWGIVFITMIFVLLGFLAGYFLRTQKWFLRFFNRFNSIGYYFFLGIMSFLIFFVLYKH